MPQQEGQEGVEIEVATVNLRQPHFTFLWLSLYDSFPFALQAMLHSLVSMAVIHNAHIQSTTIITQERWAKTEKILSAEAFTTFQVRPSETHGA